MKSKRVNLEMAIFLFYLIVSNTCLNKEGPRLLMNLESQDLESIFETFRNEQMSLSSAIKDFKSRILDSKENNVEKLNLNKTFNELEKRISEVQGKLKTQNSFVENLKRDLAKTQEDDIKGFEDFKKNMLYRKKNGFTYVNGILRRFLDKKFLKSSLDKLDDLFIKEELESQKHGENGRNNLKKNNINKRGKLLRNNFSSGSLKKRRSFMEYSSNQILRTRISSSFRLDEIVNNVILEEASGEDIVRAGLVSVLASVPPAFCWVHESNLASTDVICKPGYSKKASVCYEECKDNETEVGGLCFTKCGLDEKDCNLFCSKTDCENPQDFYLKSSRVRTFDLAAPCKQGYYKRGGLCYPVCEEIGYVTCSDRTCALTDDLCKKKLKKIPINILKAFVNYLSHIYTIRSNKIFGWSDLRSLNQSLKTLNSFGEGNLEMVHQIDKVYKRIQKTKDHRLLTMFGQRVMKYGSFFFKKKNNEPVTRLILLADFTKIFLDMPKNSFLYFIISLFGIKSRVDWNICRNDRINKKCYDKLERFAVEIFPFYILGFLTRYAQPLCPFR